MSFVIDKNVPMPAKSRAAKYPWRELEIGDSFFVPAQHKINITAGGMKAVPGSKWAYRVVTENGVRGVRVWRVK